MTPRRWRCPECGRVNVLTDDEVQWCDYCQIGFDADDLREGASDETDNQVTHGLPGQAV